MYVVSNLFSTELSSMYMNRQNSKTYHIHVFVQKTPATSNLVT